MKKARAKPSKRAPKDFVLGRNLFAKISAIEGIKLTAEMEADFAEFDRRGLSAEERRKAIVRKYGNTGFGSWLVSISRPGADLTKPLAKLRSAPLRRPRLPS